jgi:DNA polymerase-3 subunit epsilon
MQQLQYDKPIVFFDLETTGISAPHDRIVELTAIKVQPDGRRDVWTKRMNPGMPIPKSATEVHGISNEMVAGEPPFSFFAAQLKQFIGDADLAGFGISRLDIPLLEAEFRRAGMEFSRRGRRIVDTQIIYHLREPRNLAAAYKKYCGSELTDAHTSEADVEASMAVLDGMLRMYADLPCSVEGLNSICNSEQENWLDSQGKFAWSSGVAVVGFGKYKGVPIRTIAQNDPGYFDWMLKSDFAEDTKGVAARALRGDFPDTVSQ